MRLLEKYKSDQKGSFAIKLGLLFPVLLLASGVAIDYARLASAHSKLQNAADSSALNAAVIYNSSSAEERLKYKNSAEKAFTANLGEAYELQSYNVDKTANESMVVDARITLKPVFMNIFGYPRLETTVNSEVNIGDRRKTEVALVVDHSGSLIGNGGYSHLSTALDVFLDNVTDKNDMGDLFVSFIPWAGSVNIGSSNTSWLNAYDSSIFGPDNWHGCVMSRNSGRDLTDEPPFGAGRFDPYAWPSDSINNWAGRPVADYADYTPFIGDESIGPNSGCSVEMVPLTNKRADIENGVDIYQNNIVSRTGTFTPHALVWGHRALSPKWRTYWSAPLQARSPLMMVIK